MRLFRLDPRLSAVAEKIPDGCRVWDVGSDHARLPVWLAATGRITSAVASDIGEMPLASARRTVERFGVADRVSLRLCDGIPPDARGAADVFVLAGMGGSTEAEILLAAPWTQEPGVRLVLQPMSSPEDLRRVLYGLRYRVTGEDYVRDGGRRYVIIEAAGGGEPESFDRADLAAGKHIRDPEHIARSIERLTNELGGADESARRELTAAIAKLKNIMNETVKFTVRRAGIGDAETLARLAAKVYDAPEGELAEEYRSGVRKASRAMFLAEKDGAAIGFMEASMRREYVNGADDEPVAFCEGVFVEEEHRRTGAAKALLAEAERWASEKGARTFASDRPLENEVSGAWHESAGFRETERVVYYAKPCEPRGGGFDGRFWAALDTLVSESEIVIDRPKGSAHPRFPDMIYPLDYGYLKGTSSMDGGGIDVFVGSAGGRSPDAVAVILDMLKRDSEIKLLLGCTAEEKETVLRFLNDKMMSAVLIERE